MNGCASGALVAFMPAASHFTTLPVRSASVPSRTNSVRRAPYSKLLHAGVPPLQAWSQSA